MDSSVAFVVFTLIAIVKTKRYIKRNSPVTPSPEDILLGKDANGKKEVTKNED
jgi:hypothetical protein